MALQQVKATWIPYQLPKKPDMGLVEMWSSNVLYIGPSKELFYSTCVCVCHLISVLTRALIACIKLVYGVIRSISLVLCSVGPKMIWGQFSHWHCGLLFSKLGVVLTIRIWPANASLNQKCLMLRVAAGFIYQSAWFSVLIATYC